MLVNSRRFPWILQKKAKRRRREVQPEGDESEVENIIRIDESITEKLSSESKRLSSLQSPAKESLEIMSSSSVTHLSSGENLGLI